MTTFLFLWRDTDIGNTLHKDIGYSCEGYGVVRREVKLRGVGGAAAVASRRPSPKGCRAAARPERSDGSSGKVVF